jgi:hypothetical protein
MKNIEFWLNIGILLMLLLGFNLVKQNGGLLPNFNSDVTEISDHEHTPGAAPHSH